jgi:hypothetical protein
VRKKLNLARLLIPEDMFRNTADLTVATVAGELLAVMENSTKMHHDK